MKPHSIIRIGWLVLMLLMISPTVYAEQIITISEADTTFNVTSKVTTTTKIENAYPGMTLEFSPIILKNESRATIAVKLTIDEKLIDHLVLTDQLGDVIPKTFKLSPSSAYQVRMTGAIKESLGNEQQGQTLRLPITLDFTETTDDKIVSGKLPQTNESVVCSRVALLIGLFIIATTVVYKQSNREH